MIKIIRKQICGWQPAIDGMRNPMNSWDKSDSGIGCSKYSDNGIPCTTCPSYNSEYEKGLCKPDKFVIGPNDHKLMMQLADNGPVHAKYRRMIVVYVDIVAPLYWWKEFDTYKVGTVANSCSTMHKIHAKEFSYEDFSCENLIDYESKDCNECLDNSLEYGGIQLLNLTITGLNYYRNKYLETKDKKYWWQMIQLLPSSYNQKRTVMLNYEVLSNIYEYRANHKLTEWEDFCNWIKTLPASDIIIN